MLLHDPVPLCLRASAEASLHLSAAAGHVVLLPTDACCQEFEALKGGGGDLPCALPIISQQAPPALWRPSLRPQTAWLQK